MKYGARAIIWGHKILKGKAQMSDIPIRLGEKVVTNIYQYLADKGYEFPTPPEEPNPDNVL